MSANGWLQILFFLALILAVTKPMGIFMAHVFSRQRTFMDPVLRPIERLLYRVTGVDEDHEMRWTEHAIAMLLFSAVSMLLLYLIQRLQGFLPFNPQKLGTVNPPHLAFNTAASFTTNTNWQNYAGETTMSYFTQMAGLAYHNFVSAAVGIALAIAFIRGIARRQMETIGNFWVDMVRACLWVLLPFCIVGALLLVSQGVVQNLRPYDHATLVEPQQVQATGANGNPLFHGVDQHASATQPGGNMEGKEVRFGIANTALWATATTDASCGAINGWHDSFTPLGGMAPLVNIMLTEVIFGGVGAGIYGILIYIVLAVFIAGLMVGRTPEYLGKKIEAYDVKMAMLMALVFPLVILTLAAISSVEAFGTSSILNPGPHGLTEIIYAFTSQAGNNGSAFGGLTGNTPWYNISGGVTMLIGRFLMIIPMLAIAGNLAQKKYVPPSLGTFPVPTPLFTALLIGVILIVGALTFFPALSLGPILEHLLMGIGKTF